MLQREIAQRLLDLEIFQGLSRDHVERIAREADRIMFKPGQVIIRAGEHGEAAYLVLSGTASATSAFAEVQDEVVTPGTLVGELAMLVEHEHAVTIVCREPIRAVRIGREMLQATMVEAPDVAEHFVARLSARLTRMATELRRIDQMLALAGSAEPAGAGT
jgi:CRP-like cAMP-binding protein